MARKFFPGQKICNRRLRKLFDLHCIDRFFPPVETGSALQHVVLDYAGAKAINIDIRKINELPSTFFHTILVTEFVVEFPGDLEVEKDFGVVRPDLYYPGMAIEIDTGTEGYRVLKEKARRYNRYNFDWIIFVTAGNPDRIKTFFKNIRSARHKAGATFKDLKKLIKKIQEMA